MKSLNPSQLKALVDSTGSHFFDRDSMKFFGDTMRNYGVRQVVVEYGDEVLNQKVVYELYRKKPVKHQNQSSAFFNEDGKLLRSAHISIVEYVK